MKIKIDEDGEERGDITFNELEKKQQEHHLTLPLLAVLFFVLLFAQYYLYGTKSVQLKENLPVEDSVNSGMQIKSLTQKLNNQAKIKKFSSYDELQLFVENNSSGNNYGGSPMFDSLSANGSVPMAEKSISAASGMAGADYSQTNVQVAGVDEADLVKTDGQYIYSVADKTLFITRAIPADSAEVEARIEFKSSPQSIYLQGDRLVIFGDDQESMTADYYRGFKRKSPYSFFKVFDVSDHKNPKQIRNLNFEGSYLNSRMIGNYVYFITSTHAQYYDGEIPVPRILNEGKEIYDGKDLTTCLNCPPVYYFDMPYDSMNLVNVSAINIADEKENLSNQVYLLSGEQSFYASQNNLYITYTKHLSEYDLFMGVARDSLFAYLSAMDQERISKIEAIDDSILTQREKMTKVSGIIERYLHSLNDADGQKIEKELMEKMKDKYADISKELEKTVIHKIAIAGNKIEYKTFGEVTGAVLNQFSMDEDAGNFRIATTKNRDFVPLYFFNNSEMERMTKTTNDSISQGDISRNQSYSNLYVLDADLKVIGGVENLAPGERIYSARFMQNRAYLVTFKQTDPLFVIDLKEARNPKVLGQLKVPGFSSYLHPYDENTLIGLGKSTEENDFGGVVTKGLKLSLFDVSDVSRPREIDKYELGGAGSDSLALTDHKAFLFSREKDLLVVPVQLMNNSPDVSVLSQEPFSGVAVFSVNKSGFELKGKISQNINANHPTLKYSYSDSAISRSLYIGDNLYTISDQYLQVNNLNQLGLIKKVTLKGAEDFKVVPMPAPVQMPLNISLPGE